MKGKKLVVLAFIAAIAMFTVMPTPSAHSSPLRTTFLVPASYYVTGSGQCIFSPTGFDTTTLTPIAPTTTVAAPTWTMYDGVYTFKPDGSFTANLNSRVVSTAGGSWSTLAYRGTYAIAADGVSITLTVIPPSIATCIEGVCGTSGAETFLSNAPVRGSISPLRDILEMHCGITPLLNIETPDGNPLPFELMCNFTVVGFRCLGQCKTEPVE
jgi:hypothetical protein